MLAVIRVVILVATCAVRPAVVAKSLLQRVVVAVARPAVVVAVQPLAVDAKSLLAIRALPAVHQSVVDC